MRSKPLIGILPSYDTKEGTISLRQEYAAMTDRGGGRRAGRAAGRADVRA